MYVVVFSQSEQSKQEEQDSVIEWVTKEWLDKYFEMSLRAGTVSMPSIIASYTDMPFYPQGGFSSTTENSAIRKITAEEWIQAFHEELNKLPLLHQGIIKEKYLKRDNTGVFIADYKVYQELHIGRTIFYRRQKEALYWLGLALIVKKKEMQSEV